MVSNYKVVSEITYRKIRVVQILVRWILQGPYLVNLSYSGIAGLWVPFTYERIGAKSQLVNKLRRVEFVTVYDREY